MSAMRLAAYGARAAPPVIWPAMLRGLERA